MSRADKKATPTERLYSSVARLISSKYFFYGVLLLATAQGVWYALSFQPSLFDETKHLEKIFIYSHHFSPFLGNQNPAWDYVGPIARDGSYFFYYVMSWPLRLVRVFTDNAQFQILSLRMLCLGFFVAGLAVYRKALLEAGKIPKAAINLSLLFFVITPAFAALPGAVNYDNVVFFLFSYMLLLGVQSVKSRKILPKTLLTLLMLGLIMSIVKWTAIALFIPLFLYITYDLYQKFGRKLPNILKASFKTIPTIQLILLLAAVCVLIGLFIERPVQNQLRYGSANGRCEKVIGKERCMKFDEYSIYAQVDAKKPKDFKPLDPAQYAIRVMGPRMINAQVAVLPVAASSQGTGALPIIQTLYFTMVPLGLFVGAMYVRDFLKTNTHKLLLSIASVYSLVLLSDLYKVYVKHGAPSALHSRYLLPIYPIFLCFIIMAYKRLLLNQKLLSLILFLLVLAGFSQGGGIINQSILSQDRLYTNNKLIKRYNEGQRSFLSKVVKEGRYTDSISEY